MSSRTTLKPYGLHLMIDGYGAPSHRLNDVSLLYRVLMDLPKKIGMRRIGFPHIVEITESPITGLSGFTFIMESHISVHTYSERGFFTADIYSCKTFDPKEVTRRLEQAFELKTIETKLVVRGSKFHLSPAPSSRSSSKRRRDA